MSRKCGYFVGSQYFENIISSYFVGRFWSLHDTIHSISFIFSLFRYRRDLNCLFPATRHHRNHYGYTAIIYCNCLLPWVKTWQTVTTINIVVYRLPFLPFSLVTTLYPSGWAAGTPMHVSGKGSSVVRMSGSHTTHVFVVLCRIWSSRKARAREYANSLWKPASCATECSCTVCAINI